MITNDDYERLIERIEEYRVALRALADTLIDHSPEPGLLAAAEAITRSTYDLDVATTILATERRERGASARSGIRARAIVSRCAGRDGYRIITGPKKGAFFYAAPDVEGRSMIGVEVEVRFNSDDQFAFEVRS